MTDQGIGNHHAQMEMYVFGWAMTWVSGNSPGGGGASVVGTVFKSAIIKAA